MGTKGSLVSRPKEGAESRNLSLYFPSKGFECLAVAAGGQAGNSYNILGPRCQRKPPLLIKSMVLDRMFTD